MTILEVSDINTFYGYSHILHGASLSVEEDQVVFLLGRNGVGKTTTFRSIMGIPSPKSGSIMFCGDEIIGYPTHKIARLGITLVPEGRQILGGLSVKENLEIARGLAANKKDWDFDRIYKLFPILEGRVNQDAITLSGGEQQMLAVARGLMTNPKLLLVDEPVLGLAPLVAQAVENVLVELKREGITMCCIDDDIRLASRAADIVYFMDNGKIVWQGEARYVIENKEEIAERYLGLGYIKKCD